MASRLVVGVGLAMLLGGCSLTSKDAAPPSPTASVATVAPSSAGTEDASPSEPVTLEDARRSVAPAVARLLTTRWEHGADADGEHQIVECQMFTGTGFFVEPDLLVTAAHVVADHDQLRVTVGQVSQAAEVVGFSSAKDVALIHVDDDVDDTVAFGPSPVEVGDEVGTLGYSAGRGISFDRGDVNRVGVKVEVEGNFLSQLVEVNFAATSGNSGAPVFDNAGDVVGIHVAGLPNGAGQRLVVPASVAEPLVRQWASSPEPLSEPSVPCPALVGEVFLEDSPPTSDVDPELAAAWVTYNQYVLAVNDGDLPTAYAQLAIKDLGYAAFVAGVETSQLSEITSRQLVLDDGVPRLDVDFVSRQDEGHGPQERPDETCTQWHLRYLFDDERGVPLIASARTIPGNRQNEPCR